MSCGTTTSTTTSSARRSHGATQRLLKCTRLIRGDRLSRPQGQRDGIGYCNITKCCTKVCPEHITITDNAIIPLKERVVDEFYDPLTMLFRIFKPSKSGS